ncbi:MAG: preprotein translocase subunit YajC [Gammaproteobacteria bacterium]|jgi:preprotein translocase subunit YajC|nr:preprotein translocase subunit YajC [Gammaproteobacteria bacterium]NBT44749.1 preprotein translocase subunit YajC [Gammaproteobacteria bacterium]NBY22123.1 preprotein translocase subunit YajC [Gammaproteobacteria bacterium]NDE34881.1 preprotein translocase subunit YajC [Gammaproteobacteria bacterium]NDE56878.1 preprotein translocase subunit YajC [Gammaproteobacteria bacterium]
MGFFISDALAEAAPAAAQDPGVVGLILPLGIMAAFFFLFILPQQRKTKEHKKMVDALGKGSEVVTTGGLLGRVIDLDDNFVELELSDNVHVHVQRNAVASLLPKGTFKVRKKSEK